MKPSESVLLGAGWSEDDIYYEVSSLGGGFFEIRWTDDKGGNGHAVQLTDRMHYDRWVKTRSEAMTIYNAVVAVEDTVSLQSMRTYSKVEEIDPFTLDDEPINCAECFFNNMVCSIHQQEVVSSLRRVESMVDKVKEQVAVKKVAHQEYKDALKRSEVLQKELLDLLEGVTGTDPVVFTATFDGRRSHQVDKPEERESRTYRVYRWRSTAKMPWRVTIECRMPSGSWSSNSVMGFHRLELLEYLLGHETKVVNRDEMPQMPW